MRYESVIIWSDKRLEPFAEVKEVKKEAAEINVLFSVTSNLHTHIFANLDVKYNFLMK